MTQEPTFRQYDGATAPDVLKTVIIPLYEASHPDRDEFHSTDRFVERTRGYMRAPGFGMVAAYIDDQPVALAFGYTLPQNARWWNGLNTPVEPDLIEETGSRTFAVNEVMTHPDWQRKGLGSATHTELLRSRTEERATLLVNETNTPAVTGYEKMGYRKIGKLKPFPDAPNFDAMILPLPITPA